MTEVHWPAGHEPDGATVYVVNRATSHAPPAAIWAWTHRPDQWSSYYANARRVRSKAGPWPEVELDGVLMDHLRSPGHDDDHRARTS